MPVHNGMPWLQEAVSSILQQTCGDFEFLIMDDASTDDTPHFLRALTDTRVKLVRHEEKRGITLSLIEGIKASQGAFIARMDADDIAMPQRLAIQLAHMQKTPRLGVLGSQSQSINGNGQNTGESIEMPLTDAEIRLFGAWNSPFVHPSVMIRSSLLGQHDLNYSAAHAAAQDYALWFQCLEHAKGENLPVCLLRYRRHQHNVSVTRRDTQKTVRRQVSREFLEKILAETGPGIADITALHRAMIGDPPEADEDRDDALICLFRHLALWSSQVRPGEVSRRFLQRLSQMILKANRSSVSASAMLRALNNFGISAVFTGLPFVLRQCRASHTAGE
jgi:glycosyltransferase involved in cell wall biosynthesis